MKIKFTRQNYMVKLDIVSKNHKECPMKTKNKSKLKFYHLKKSDILGEAFNSFQENNVIDFSQKGIAICYAPNGTGKSTITKILGEEKGTVYKVEYENRNYEKDLFHIISDQSSRNLIKGETEEFILGNNIKREKELEKKIDDDFNKRYLTIISKLKELNITKKTEILVNLISSLEIKKYVEKLASSQDKGKTIEKMEFIENIKKLNLEKKEEYDISKFNFIILELNDKNSILNKILKIAKIKKQEGIRKIEESEEAINILAKYAYKKECIVCDTGIDNQSLFKKKSVQKSDELNKLSIEVKKIIEDILDKMKDKDPLDMKKILIETIESGDLEKMQPLKLEVEKYKIFFNERIKNIFLENITSQEIEKDLTEYNQLLRDEFKIEDEDFSIIKNLIEENIEKSLLVTREDKKIKIKLNNREILENEFELSAGEQNFLSLAFEFLKAKNTEKKIIVIDDPISSFDSIYKNKIAFLMIKIFEDKGKKILVFTHNLELPRLLMHQVKNSFNFYLLNNKEDENNGFIPVVEKEIDLLMYLDRLTSFFREGVSKEVEDKKIFLISMIPFMRGYANITGNNFEKNQLTQVMHGYTTEKIDINEIYYNLFEVKLEELEVKVNVSDILSLDLNNLKILKDKTEYSLLNKTLNHTLTYLFLRLKVEKVLVKKYSINTNNFDMLAKIIFKSYESPNNEETRSKRIFLNSKKTLLNEFNHFEGNLSIFQPAIDITDKALKLERDAILKFLESEEST